MTQADIAEQTKQDEQLQFSSFYLGDTLCGINIKHVQEINEDLNITRVPLAPDYVMGIMNLRGQIVTIVNQSMKIGLVPSPIGRENRVVIVESKDEFIGLLVDRVAEVETISRSAITEPPSNIKGVQGKFFEGVVHVASNELMALLDIEAVLADS